MLTDEQSRLENALESAATDPTRIPDFLAALIDAIVLVPGFKSDGPDAESEGVNLAVLANDAGTSVQPFYTSEDRLQETLTQVPQFEHRFLAMRCRDLWQTTLGAELVLNPHSARGKVFLAAEIQQLLAGAASLTTTVVDHPTTILVGRPAHIPDGMEGALSDLFRPHPGVEAAFLGWKATQETGDNSYLLVIVGDPELRAELSDELARALVYFSQAHPVDVMWARDPTDHAMTSIEPFYVRSKG
jgi:hypothetical protein